MNGWKERQTDEQKDGMSVRRTYVRIDGGMDVRIIQLHHSCVIGILCINELCIT